MNAPLHQPIAERILDAFPSGSYALSALLRLMDIVESTEVPTAAVECRAQPRLLVNPEFLAQLEAEGFACDILFVDGDHSYAQVRADWDAYRGFVRPGGFLVFDDYGMADSTDVKRAVDGVVLSLAQEARERALVGAEASWSVWGQLANTARARPPEMALNNEFILHRVR